MSDLLRRYLNADMSVGQEEAYNAFCDLLTNHQTEIEDFKSQLTAERSARQALEAKLEEADKALQVAHACLDDAAQSVAIYGDEPPQIYMDALHCVKAALSRRAARGHETEEG